MSEVRTIGREPELDIPNLKERERAALAALEVFLPEPRARGVAGRDVVLVGAGAVNLIVALALLREGARVRIVEARADPRTTWNWADLGCTFGGHDSRIFSMTEARQHHVREGLAGGTSAYRHGFDTKGWLCCDFDRLDDSGRAWIDLHERIPGWLLKLYGEDIIAFNFESWNLWTGLREAYPALFAPPVFREGLVRTYPSREAMERAKATEESVGASAREIPLDELSRSLPALSDAVKNGHIAGALSVAGFSVNIHTFGRRLLDLAEAAGATFIWNKPARGVVRDKNGAVLGVRVEDSDLAADDYVLSPGAFGPSLFDGFLSEGSIAGVMGAWVAIPNDEPRLHMPLKISRSGFGAPGAAEGANVVPGVDAAGRDILVISSGHGFLGILPADLDHALIRELTRAPRETAERYFPANYQAALSAGFDIDERYCIRPWTATGLGIFETAPAAHGTLVIATGHNTGGFAQGPAIARAVIAALSGRSHPMQALYHPLRCTAFLPALA